MARILFVRPDLNSTFAQRKELINIGAKPIIFLGLDYPKKLLFDSKQVVGKKFFKKRSGIFRIFNVLINFAEFLFYSFRSDYIIYYGSPPLIKSFDKFFNKKSFSLELHILKKIFKKHIVFQSTGCREEYLKKDFKKFDNGKICGNCGYYDTCNDEINAKNFDLIKKYSELNIGYGFVNSNQYKQHHFKYKSIDLELFSPSISIPRKFLLKKFDGLTIYHSSFIKESGRDLNGKDIKGSKYIIKAIDKLISEGFKIRKLILTDIPMKDLRYYQVQSDIVVDQLIYGCYGSTGIECMALGKPVISYINSESKKFFLKNFDEFDDLPIIEANPGNIYNVLKELVEDSEKIKHIGFRSRKFVEKQYNPKINSKILLNKLKYLKL